MGPLRQQTFTLCVLRGALRSFLIYNTLLIKKSKPATYRALFTSLRSKRINEFNKVFVFVFVLLDGEQILSIRLPFKYTVKMIFMFATGNLKQETRSEVLQFKLRIEPKCNYL